MASPSKHLGYVIMEAVDGTYRGAVLVTDFRGIPADFRYTDPITPSRVEKILYGSSLEAYLREELILGSLTGAVELQPLLWIGEDEGIPEPLARITKTRSILLGPTNRPPFDKVGMWEKQNEPGSCIFQADPLSAPLRLSIAGGEGRDEDMKNTVALLVDAASTMDILEPFSRMGKVLSAIAEEKDGN